MKDYRFKDADIQRVVIGPNNIEDESVDIVLKDQGVDVEAIVIYKEDVLQLAKHFGIID